MCNKKGKIKNCLICGKEIYVYPSKEKEGKGKYCSNRCFGLSAKGKHFSVKTEFKKGERVSIKTEFKKGSTGNKCLAWKGGVKKCSGYIRIYKPKHPGANKKYVLEHRLIAEKYLGRYLKPSEIIHHINENKEDNRIENLYLFENIGEHNGFHNYKIKPILKSNLID